ncbi:MAG: sugar kinase [Gammaproteobacteria bacterium]|nr:sugar kinase [Gammaproteobacteria bacterium]
MAQYKIAIIGECMAELSGSLFNTMQQGFGGDTMNTAIYLKQLMADDVQVSYVTVMGNDNLSDAMIEKWQDYDVDTQFVLRDERRHCGLYMIQNEDNGERHFQYWRSDAAAKFIMQHPQVLEVFNQLATYDAVFLSGISIAILSDADRSALMSQLFDLREKGVKILFDGNYRSQLWSSVEQAQLAYKAIYKLCDLALVTHDDEALLWGDANVDATINRLQLFDIAELVTKDGANGCYYTKNSETCHIGTKPIKQVVDTTAAGDSFNAGFLAGWLQTMSLVHTCQMGNQTAAQVIQQKGAIIELNTDLIGVSRG